MKQVKVKGEWANELARHGHLVLVGTEDQQRAFWLNEIEEERDA